MSNANWMALQHVICEVSLLPIKTKVCYHFASLRESITFVDLQYGFCQSIETDILKRLRNILYRSPVVIFAGLIQFEVMSIVDKTTVDEVQHDLYVQDDRAEAYKRMSKDSDEEFEATYKVSDEDEDGDRGSEVVAKTSVILAAISQSMDVPPFMGNIDLDTMHAPEFPKYANIGIADLEDGEFKIRMEYGSKKSVIVAIQSYTISRGVDYVVYESVPQTFYIRRYNRRHKCSMDMISQDYSKLDSNTIAEATKPLIESNPSIKLPKSLVGEAKSIVKVFGGGEESYQALSDCVGIISDRHESIRTAVNRSRGDWKPPRVWWMFCIQHIGSNFLREFMVSYLQKLVANIGYSMTVEEYNVSYKRL
ncbi:hypothetical protein Ahy_A05g025194 [Arachis hypogaea]|uniref:Transposase MuDR plant domain-containing protein n=1 Tax=Arachis hypogaea TaxID=3818 RepID=A0A445D7U7_ARAHY|nr:hypothetical protein Ahy_A05g025194 [Arachis hypogaea]